MAATFQNAAHVDPTGRIQRVVTSKEEADRLVAEGWTKGELPDAAALRAELNSGKEGNDLAAESSTTKVGKDGVNRAATSGR